MPALQGSRSISGAVTPTTNDDGWSLRVTANTTVTLTNSGWTIGRSGMFFPVVGAASVTFVAGASVTIRNVAGDLVQDRQYDGATALYTGTNEWTIYGSEDAVPNLAVTTGKLADGAVTAGKLADGAVTLAKQANVTGPTALGRVSGTGAPQALTPAQMRQAAQVAGPVFSVEAEGAVGDDSNDDLAALDAAVARAIAAGGGIVELMPGKVHRISDTWDINASAARIIIRPNGATVKSANATVSPIISAANPASGFLSIENNLRIVGFGKGGGQTGLYLEDALQVGVARLRINNVTTGIELQNIGTGYCEHNDFEDIMISSAEVGVRFDTDGTTRSMRGNKFRHFRTSGVDIPVQVANNCTIYNTRFDDYTFWFDDSQDGVSPLRGFDLVANCKGFVTNGSMENILPGATGITAYYFGNGCTHVSQADIECVLTNTGFTPYVNATGAVGEEAQFDFRLDGNQRFTTNKGYHRHPYSTSTTYTLQRFDAGALLEFDAAAEVTVPDESSVWMPNGTVVDILQFGANRVTTTTAGSATLVGARSTMGIGSILRLVKRSSNAWWGIQIGNEQATAWKTSAQAVNDSTTLVDDANLLFAVRPNERWTFEATLLVTASNVTPGFRFGLTVPSGAIMWVAGLTTRGSDDLSRLVGPATTSGAAVTGGGVRVGTDPVRVWGYVVTTSTGGVAQLQWAQNTATASNTVVGVGSHLVARRLN